MEKSSVGKKVWLEIQGNQGIKVEGAIITKVGRVYFYCRQSEWSYEYKFMIKTMEESCNSGYRAKAYLSEKEVFDKIEYDKLKIDIYRYFSGFNTNTIDLESLREVKAIIDKFKN